MTTPQRKITGTSVALLALALSLLTATVGFSAANGAAIERLDQQEKRIDRLELSIAAQLSAVQTDVREIRVFLLGDRRHIVIGGLPRESE